MGSVLASIARTGSPDPRILDRMAAAAPHRGRTPVRGAIGAVGLAATGSDAGQGWVAVAEDLVVAFTGVLDNAEELAAAWRVARAPDAPTPAHVVAAGIRLRGAAETARRLRGVFGVVASDGRGVWAFRDPLGFQPLVQGEGPTGLLLATEPKQIAAATGEGAPDVDTVRRIFYGDPLDDGRCAVAGVTRLAAGALLTAGPEGTTRESYWDPERLLERGDVRGSEIPERFRALFEQAVRRCLTGEDVVSLSGGVDSPAVAAYAAPLHLARIGRPLAALSAVFPDQPAVDESGYIEAVARELGLELTTMRPAARPMDDIREWTRLFDGPVPIVAFPQVHEFLTTARALGFRNVLSGELEEFVFEMRRGLLPHLVASGRIAAALRHARTRRARGDRFGMLARAAAAGAVPPRAWQLLGRAKRARPVDLPAWIDPRAVGRYGGEEPSRTWRSDQLVAFGKASISVAADSTIQEVAGVRERRPFADVDLWEFALGLPAEAKHGEPGSKALLRRLLRGTVPDVVLDRRDKTVFDRHVEAGIDYPALRAWLVDPPGERMPGIDYRLLGERLDAERLTLREFVWAKDLAAVHAFLAPAEVAG